MFYIYQTVTLGNPQVIYSFQTLKKGTGKLISFRLITQEVIFLQFHKYLVPCNVAGI